MKTYTANQNVEAGLYLNLKKFAITSLDADGPLPGTADDTYRRVPMLLMLAVAPLLGLVFVIFLPFIGFAMVAHLLGTKAVQFVQDAVGETARVRRPGWVPALAYFSRSKRAERAKAPDAPKDAWTEDVEKKLEKTDHTA